MRVVLTLTEPIPELVELLARAGAHVTFDLSQDEYPVEVTAYLGWDALAFIVKRASALRLPRDAPSARVLRALADVLESADAAPPPPRPKVVE